MNATTLSCNSGAPAAPQDPPPVCPETCRKCLGTGKDFDAEFGVHTCRDCGGTGRREDARSPAQIEDDDDLIAVGSSMHRRIDVERWCS